MIDIDTGTDELLCHIQDRVAVITLNKPNKKNALGDVLTPALRKVLLTVEADDRVGCVMITGTGDAFCAGGDVSDMGSGKIGPVAELDKQRVADLVYKQETLTLRIYESSKITIAALPGVAAGAGFAIALACDLRVASNKAFITTGYRNVGLSGDYGGSWLLPRLIGLSKAKELYYTADRVYAEEAERLGIFNQVFPEASFRTDALTYASGIADGPTAALGLMKANLNRGVDVSLRESLLMEAENLITSAKSDEFKEATRAFLEKRPPKFHHELDP